MQWTQREREAFRPPERLTVSQWADRYRILDPRTSAQPGPWRTARTPYLRAIMDAWTDPEIEHLILCFGTQLGKTETALNCLGYAIHQDPGPALIVYPTDDLAEFASENRIQPMIRSSPALAERWNERESEKLELQFASMYVALGGANSPSKLASRPVRYLIRDEIDKFPRWTGQEANPLSLSEERTKTFYNRRILDASTPTLRTGPIWQMLESADRLMKYEIPCPHCGRYQILQFKQIKFPEEQSGYDIQRRAEAAFYECEHCHGSIDDQQRLAALRLGRWTVVRSSSGPPRSVAFHLSSLYSPWVTWAQIVHEFLSSKDFPEKLMNFINSWLAEPWEQQATRMRSDIVLAMAAPHERGRVPDEAVLLTGGVDVQQDHLWWTVRAWGEHLTSWLVDYGRVETWDELDTVIERNYVTMSGEPLQIQLAGIDSGHRTEEVYEFCAAHQGYCVPMKGSSAPLRVRYQVTQIERGVAAGLRLYLIDTGQFKDFIHGRLRRPCGTPGAWMVCQGVERLYADHICSEQKIPIKDRKGRIHEEWQPISSHAANHLLDAEVYAAAAAEILHVRYLHRPEPPAPGPSSTSPAAGRAGWLERREGWLRRR